MTPIIKKAKEFAQHHHSSIDQRRKYTNEPYIVHPAAVAKLVSSVPHTEAMIAAAWLHDTVEDTPATIEMVQEEFGEAIAVLVEMLTDISKPEDGNRVQRKSIDRDHTAQASAEAKTIKLADLIHNSETILKHDLEFAKVYMAEKAALLNVLREGDQVLFTTALAIVERYSTSLARTISRGGHDEIGPNPDSTSGQYK